MDGAPGNRRFLKVLSVERVLCMGAPMMLVMVMMR
jgi:hypothetical protein